MNIINHLQEVHILVIQPYVAQSDEYTLKRAEDQLASTFKYFIVCARCNASHGYLILTPSTDV